MARRRCLADRLSSSSAVFTTLAADDTAERPAAWEARLRPAGVILIPAGHPHGCDMGKIRKVPTSIDKHEKRPEIEAALAAGTPLQRIADRYGMSAATLCRHRQRMRHEQPELFEALVAKKWRVVPDEMEELRTEMSDGYLKKLYWRDAFLTNQELRAYEAENWGAGAQISGRVHKNLELIGQAVKQIGSDTIKIQQNIVVMPEFHAFRSAMLEALRDHPEIRAQVERRAREMAEGGPQTIALPAGRAA